MFRECLVEMIMAVCVVFCFTQGCITSQGDAMSKSIQETAANLSSTEDIILNHTDVVYNAVRVIIMDEEILPLIDEDTLTKLKDLEKIYLIARDNHLSGDQMNTRFIDILKACSEDLLDIMDVIPGISKYADTIKTAKTAIRLLNVMLTPVDAEV